MEEFLKKYFNKKVLLTYLYGAFASRFLGFIVSMWAVSLVGHFFEFPTFKNLWGLNSHKTLVSKATFENLKWVSQVLIGFFVFEIFHKTLFSKATTHAPEYYNKGIDYLEKNGHLEKLRKIKETALNQVKKDKSKSADTINNKE
jgi:hypothetical protein